MNDAVRADADGGWKDIIEDFAEEFFLFYFPQIHEAIDFGCEVKFLDGELRQIVPESEVAGREADKLMEVRLKDGRIEWLLIHVEIQGYHDRDFAERMFICNYRVFDRYRRDVISLAVLTDADTAFRPTEYSREMLGFSLSCRFPMVKLIDYAPAELDASDNPFALVTRIHLEYLAAGGDPQKRFVARVALTRRLYRHGYSREHIIRLDRFLDFVLRLPRDLAIQYKEEVRAIEEELNMPYVTSTEKLTRLEALWEAVLDALEARFGEVPYNVREAVEQIDDVAKLRQLLRQAVLVAKLEDFVV